MPSVESNSERVRFFGTPSERLDARIREWGLPRFRADQIRDWVCRRMVTDPSRMTDLSIADRALIAERIEFRAWEIAADRAASDATRKLLLRRGDGATAETVMIPDAARRTACVSSQVGCPVGCRFCASGINGLQGNLTSDQIVEQVFLLDLLLRPRDERITNIVFMGMGEPLANYANVMAAVRFLHDPKCFNIGARRITISTVGVPAKMRDLAEEELPVNLAISLHAPNESLRRQLIPWAEHFALDDILDAARHYFSRTGREITLEYILLSGVNDRPEQARELARLCRTLRANVNLLRYNPVPGLPYIRPRSEDVMRFQEILRDAGVNAHVRKSRGRDIDAACGQLRRRFTETPIPATATADADPSPSA